MMKMSKAVKSPKTDTEKMLDKEYAKEAKKVLRVAMVKADVNYKQLAETLTTAGRPVSEQGLRNKVSGGTYSAAWFMHVLNLLDYKIG